MAKVLSFNPGSASLKFDLIELSPGQHYASEGRKVISASLEEIGKDAKLLVFKGREIDHTEKCAVADMAEGAAFAIQWLQHQNHSGADSLANLDLAAVRVVHGGDKYSTAVRFDDHVRKEVERLQELAPLHNKNSLTILAKLQQTLPHTPQAVAFDTAFHRTIPEVAWRYPIERETADRHHIRKYGFHGISHRYMLEEYARITGKPVDEVSVVALHLESGSSSTAIRHGKSIDNTMGLTPLEGLMMGTRSGSIDPAIVPYLMKKEELDSDAVMDLLNKHSGLLGIAGGTLDTRVLAKRDDPYARLALAMFAYRIRLAVGAYLAAIGDAEAVLFGGGIGEDSPAIRAEVCAGLKGWGLELDGAVNEKSTSGMARITQENSRLHAYAMPVDEGLQIAHECYAALQH